MAQFTELSEDVILHIFSFIPLRLLRRTICRVCKMYILFGKGAQIAMGVFSVALISVTILIHYCK